MKKAKVKNKRGIPFPSHIILSGILLLLQFVFLFAVVYNLSDYFAVYILSEVLAIIVVIYIVNRRDNPSYKIAWIVFILIFPIFGISVFILWGGERVMPHLKNKMRLCENHYKPLLQHDTEINDKFRYSNFAHSRQAQYLIRESGYPIYENTSVEYLSPGEKFLPKFLEELELAEKYIYLEFFIIAEGKMWDAIYKTLVRKAEQGVEIKILFDDFGSIKRQSKTFLSKLKNRGIEVAVFNRIRPTVNMFMNNRNHRKIAVIDGKTAVTGGINLADEYINEYKRFGYWMDCAVILKGDAVKGFLSMFCSMWEFTTGGKIDMLSKMCNYPVAAAGYVLPYCDGPLNSRNPAEGIYLQMLNTAQDYVYITSPYLIIDNTMITAIKNAAKSGIDVRIITPYIPDKWYVHPVTQYNYLELLEAGVRIFEYTPGFIHSKIFVSDDRVCTVGTVNMDYRSFVLHFECGAWFAGNDAVIDVKSHIDELFRASKEVKLSSFKRSPPLKKLERAILHIFSPFM